MEEYYAGFRVCTGFHSKPLCASGVPFQNELCAPDATLVFRQFALPLLVALALLIAGPKCVLAQELGIYRVDTKDSHIQIHLFKGGFLSSFGDNHLIDMTSLSGKANLSRTKPWTAELSAQTAALKVIDPWGNPSQRKEVQATMLGSQQLDASQFPTIELHSISLDPTAQDTLWHLVANVELHGVTRKESFSLDCHQTGDRIRIYGKKMFKLTDFNIQPYSRAFGAVRVKNEFEVTYNIILDRVH